MTVTLRARYPAPQPRHLGYGQALGHVGEVSLDSSGAAPSSAARKDEPELAPESRLALQFDPPPERMRRALRDRKAKAGASADAVARRLDAIEAVEDPLLVL